jgi:MYXO-CTERM domain-containing protein
MITRCSLPAAMAAALAAGLLIASVSPARANLVTDPGFESCIPPGGQAPPPGWSGSAICSASPHTGTWAAGLEAPSSTLSQSIATTPGDTYDFSFWLLNAASSPPNSFTASFGSDVVLNLSNTFNPTVYTLEDFTVTAAAASTTISFTSSSFSEFWSLDDVSVTAVPAPPLSPLGPALVGLFLLARRVYRRRNTPAGMISGACRISCSS